MPSLQQLCLHLWRVKWKSFLVIPAPNIEWKDNEFPYACFWFCSRYSYLQRYITEPLACRGDKWQPLVWYRNSLLSNEDEQSSVLGSLGEWPPVGSSKTSSFKRKLSNGMKTSQFLISCFFFVCLEKLLYLLFCLAVANLHMLKCI